jgi:mono/diheme cytochrome c family protein
MNRPCKNIARSIAALILFAVPFITALSQEWTVPADKKGKLSPFAFTDETRKAGERIFTLNCMSCHGTPGKANFLKTLVPVPGDPASDKYQANLDGEIFYKVTQGRGPMPSFKNSLSSNDIWNVISYIRSFNKNYVQKVMAVIKSSAYPDAEIGISLALDKKNELIMMRVIANSGKSVVPVKNAGVKLYVLRTFGRMVMDEEKTTDLKGEAFFKIPPGLPGDTAGNVKISAGFTDEETFGAVTKDTVLTAGEKIVPVSLTRDRAMWNVVRKAPVWVILSYSFGVLAVWGFIMLCLLKLRDIFIIGEHVAKEEEKKEPGS